MTDETTFLDICTATRYANARRLCPSIMDKLAEAESNHHGITLRLAWNRHPERFVHGTPKPQPLPQQVWINPPAAAATPRPAQ